jgi:hypothetical protein
VGDGTYEGQCARLQGPKILGNAYDSLKPVVIQQELPVLYLAIFQYPLNNIGSILNQINAVFVNIPKEVDRETLYALLH